jgi:hypothetical protein
MQHKAGIAATVLCRQYLSRPLRRPPERIPCGSALFVALDGEQPLEELAIVHQGQAEVFGRRFLATSPLFFQARARLGETRR